MRRTTVLTAVAGLTLSVGLAARPAAAAPPTCDGKVATIVVPTTPWNSPTEPVVGTPGNDVIVGTEANDWIEGAGGDDTICGLGGADTLIGGPGDDRLFGGLDAEYIADEGYYGDLVVPGPGDDHVDLGADPQVEHLWEAEYRVDLDRVSYASSSRAVVVDLTAGTASGQGHDTIAHTGPSLAAGVIGSPFDDRLTGSPARDLVVDGGGDDRVDGRGGDDLISVDATSHVSDRRNRGPAGDDTVMGGRGDDTVTSGRGRDVIRGGGGDDHLWTSSARRGSVLVGGGGRDWLSGGRGVTLRGGSGNDVLGAGFEPGTRQVVDGDRGRDHVSLRLARGASRRGQHIVVDVPREQVRVNGRTAVRYRDAEELFLAAPRGRVSFLGGPRRDQLQVSSGVRVRAWGRGGADVLFGGSSADMLDGGRGRDRVDGEKGRDRCLRSEQMRSCELHR